jgi:hypothetical protein
VRPVWLQGSRRLNRAILVTSEKELDPNGEGISRSGWIGSLDCAQFGQPAGYPCNRAITMLQDGMDPLANGQDHGDIMLSPPQHNQNEANKRGHGEQTEFKILTTVEKLVKIQAILAPRQRQRKQRCENKSDSTSSQPHV